MFKGSTCALLFSMALGFSAIAQTPPDSATLLPIQAGLYQSAPISAAGVPEDETHRLFLRVFQDGRASMVISPASAESVKQQFENNRDMAGEIAYSILNDAIEFNFGPTEHKVSTINPQTVLLRSEYPNGNTSRVELELVVPDGR